MKEHDKQAKAIDSFDYDSGSLSDDDKAKLSTQLIQNKSHENSGTSFPKEDNGKYKGFIGTPDSNSFDPDI